MTEERKYRVSPRQVRALLVDIRHSFGDHTPITEEREGNEGYEMNARFVFGQGREISFIIAGSYVGKHDGERVYDLEFRFSHKGFTLEGDHTENIVRAIERNFDRGLDGVAA